MVSPYPQTAQAPLAGNVGALIQPAPPSGAQNFNDITGGIRSIAQNVAAGFSKDPRRREEAQQQIAIQDQQRQQELQQLRAQQLHFMDQMTELATQGGLTPAVRQMIQNASPAIDQLLGAGTAAAWQPIYEAADAASKAKAQEGFTLGEGQQRFDASGKIIAEGPAKSPSPSDVLGPIEQKLATGKPLTPGEQKIYEDSRPQGTNISIDARPVSDAQSKALGFADRMSAANDVIEGLNYQPTTLGNAVSDVPVIGNALTSEQHQQFNQAKLDFMSADLRKESGAVITGEEYAAEDAKYFPQPNDKPETIKQKAEARKRVILNTYREGRNVTGAEAGSTAAEGTAKATKKKVLKYDPATDSLTPVE